MSLLKCSGYKYSKYKSQTAQKIKALQIITTENEELGSCEIMINPT
jgi:hypothetical protein